MLYIRMRRLALRQFKLFEAAARNLSYSRAATELHSSQPAVSMQVNSLETFVGLPLTEQLGKKTFLTQAGPEVFRVSRNITAQLSDPKTALVHLKGAESGQFNMGVTSTANSVATHFLTRYRGMRRRVSTDLAVSNREEMSSNEASKQAVQAGLGLGLLSLNAWEQELALKHPSRLDAEDFRIMRHGYIVHRADKRLSPVTLAFKAFVLAERASHV